MGCRGQLFCRADRFRRPAGMVAIVLGTLIGVVVFSVAGARADDQELVAGMVEASGIDRGVCALLGGDAGLAVELARSTKFLVDVRRADAAGVAQVRRAADEAGFGIDRVVAERGGLERLPYADRVVDLLVAPVDAAALDQLKPEEVLRVLRPEGVALVGQAGKVGDKLKEKLEDWADGIDGAELLESTTGAGILVRKPAAKGVDAWSVWEHGPDNNPVSKDTVIKAPYMTQFLAQPFYIGMPAITTAAGGRTFLATGHIAHHRREWDMLNQLIARNGYNGTVLWQRALPAGFLSHRSAFVATEDVFYLLDGDGCLKLDAATGEELGRLEIPAVDGDWKWMTMEDGVLYVMAGPRGGEARIIKGDRSFGGWSWADLSVGYYHRPHVPWGFGKVVAAFDLGRKRLLWKHGEDDLIDARAMALRDGKLFLYCPEKHLRCLDAKTGEVLWTNANKEVAELIEQPGRGLVSTPGFRSGCLAVATPDALILQGQTRMNVVAVSTHDGYLLWKKKKVTNNPNCIFVDGKAVLGIGRGGSHVVIDPVSGAELEDLGFRKTSCTRLTASPDSFFVRGEGTLRFDRATKKVLIDGGARPACNDGAIPANGLLYLGPWACDCNLSLIGAIGECSAGDFRFDREATNAERLELGEGDPLEVAPFEISEGDWPTYRANNRRSASTSVRLARPADQGQPPNVAAWVYSPQRSNVPTPPVAAGGLILVAGSDGRVRALKATSGAVAWEFATGGPIKYPPTLAQGRAYVGSGDGYAYCLEAATGRLLWRFRAAPVERRIMVYGNLISTWPVNSGVLVHEGVAYFAAGIIDHDGTHVYAVDAKTGKIKWQNNTCGHLNAELRKGVSVQGNLAVMDDKLMMAGGNQVSPAIFDLADGECLNPSFAQGNPKANHGKFVGVLGEEYPIAGGRILYASPRNVANKDSFVVVKGGRPMSLDFGGVPPAWNEEVVALVNYRGGKLTCYDGEKAMERIEEGFPPAGNRRARHWYGFAQAFDADGAARWQTNLDAQSKFEVISLAVTPDMVAAVVQFQTRNRAQPQWQVVALDAADGALIRFWRHDLPGEPLPEGLAVSREGGLIVTLLDGRVLSLAPRQPRRGARG